MQLSPKPVLKFAASETAAPSLRRGAPRRLGLRGVATRLAALALLAGLVSGSVGCSAIAKRQALENCKFDLEAVELVRAGYLGVEMRFLVGIENPNPIDVVVDRLEFELFTGGKKIGQGVHQERIDVPPGVSETIALDVKASASELGIALLTAITSNSGVDYKVQGTAFVETILGEFPYPFSVEDTFQQ